MKTKILQLCLILLGLFLTCQKSFADGVYIPAAKKKLPDIPIQRALVKYQEGIESLIVESTYIKSRPSPFHKYTYFKNLG